MLTAILVTVLYGAVWGFLWGGLDAIFLLKGFLASNNPLPSILRSFISMLITSFFTGVLFSAFGIGGGGLLAVLVAVVVMIYARPWVLARWRW